MVSRSKKINLPAYPRRAADRLVQVAARLESVSLVESYGQVARVVGPLVEAVIPHVKIGEMCEIGLASGATVLCETIGFNDHRAILSPFSGLDGVGPGLRVRPLARKHGLVVGAHLLGQVLDGFGNPIGEMPLPGDDAVEVPVRGGGPAMGDRIPIDTPFQTGVRPIDGLLTLGKGQRVGVFAGPGCGKSTLMTAIAANADVDVVVFALIGERGRELAEIVHELRESGLARRTVVVGATSDRAAAERTRAAYTATAVAEGFRDQGKHVLLLVDSLTRFARAVRETSIASGEPIGRNGVPASVYAELPRLVERAGNTRHGAISGMYMVLVEGTVQEDPIADEVRSLIDGHILLTRSLAERGVFPAISILESLSRIMPSIVESDHQRAVHRLRRLLSKYQDIELLLKLGEIKSGVDKETDQAVAAYDEIMAYLQQDIRKPVSFRDSVQAAIALARKYPA
ncbi:FliI/YscN family ATPase [Noviherbaspirillum saxi]|uniref:FliI/YscN family ATPase n=1 Tax=Noviherbaspirillum saxi TaxID=2320863 RepID=A0A3A3FIF2_9BURK|nr:FliI/YscN family ATPase [Noviherbaspirillum saxi]RJF92168.1 FliI/YscN family ATPase [Noviherbaspirillum saxi]